MTPTSGNNPILLNTTWSFHNPYGALSSQLTPAGDRLVGCSGSTVFLIDINTGQPPAATDSVASPNVTYNLTNPFATTPEFAAAGGFIYFMDQNMVALRLADGTQSVGWKAPALNQVTSLTVALGNVVAVSLDAQGRTQVSGYNAVTGKCAFGPVTICSQTPGPVAYSSKAAFFIANNLLNAVNLDFGDVRWTFAAGAAGDTLNPAAAPLVTANLIVASGSNLYGVEVTKGRQAWSVAPVAAGSPRWLTPAVDSHGKTIVAANHGGDVMAINLADGRVLWHTTAVDPAAPTITGNLVTFMTSNGSVLTRLNLANGSVNSLYQLPGLSAQQAAVVGNGHLFLADVNGNVSAMAFMEQNAAFFDGISSIVDVQPDGSQFDFGLGDFTVEAWVRSSMGGEIVSSYPTSPVAGDCAFRLNMSPLGEIRVMVVNVATQAMNLGKTKPTTAADGEWHHVALLRRGGAFVVVLDGISLPVFLPATPADTLLIGGNNALAFGAFRPGPGQAPQSHFQGLLREVRVWDRALDIATIQMNGMVELTGTEARLKGLWALDESQVPGSIIQPVNAVPWHNNPATFSPAVSKQTDLTMDKSLFPYLLHETTVQWPYLGVWATRGEDAAIGAPALSANGVMAFSTNDTIYGAHQADGSRLWYLDTGNRCSAPVADGAYFWAVTADESLIAIDALTGTATQNAAFAGAVQGDPVALAAPAVSSRFLAIGTPDGRVYILNRMTGVRNTSIPQLPGAPLSLMFGASKLFVMTADFHIAVIDPAAGTITNTITASAAPFCVADAWLFCVAGGQVAQYSTADFTRPARTAAVSGGVTGLAGLHDVNLLAVGTANGAVVGLSLATLATRWTAQSPGAAAAVWSPVFDDAGRVFCTTAGGGVAVFDPATGGILGHFTAAQPILTSPALNAGTVWFACADAPPKSNRDGALHSVVFGNLVALRLGVDANGAIQNTGDHAEIVTSPADGALHLMNPLNSCVEAWINIPNGVTGGGGILSICPTQEGQFDLSLSIDADGTLHYSARSQVSGAWQGVTASAVTTASDGGWHHVAVSRNPDRLYIYFDGKALTNVVSGTTATAPTAFVSGLKAFIGANAAADLTAANMFHGLIAEVRVWDTYMVSTEIASRMNVKLRGDEPDLLAYWNLASKGINDAATPPHNGTLVTSNQATSSQAPNWWLTHLSFDSPNYPYLASTASIQGTTAGATTYTLTIKAFRPDNTGLAGQPLALYYARHNDAEPATIVIGAQSVSPTNPFNGVTGSDGTLKVQVVTTLLTHGPSIDVCAGFMPSNERFHVNVLIDNQTLPTGPPPTMTAQSKLIQDYHYTSGNVINETRDRDTWRIVLATSNADTSVRPNEPVTLWASEPVTLEVVDREYQVNLDNSVTLSTDGKGELTVVMAAADLAAPTLYARAGFMQRNDRMVIAADQDAHSQLADVKGSGMTASKLQNWSPTAPKQGALLTGDYAPHANDVATAVNHVMTSVNQTGSKPAAGLGEDTPLQYDYMRQPLRATAPDRVVTLRTIAGIPRKAPVNPDALRAALGSNLGFVFDTRGGAAGFRFQYLTTQADVDRERGTPTPTAMELGNIFSDAWDSIKSAAEDAYNDAVQLTITIGNQVEVAIKKVVNEVETIVHSVVASIKDAIDAVVSFFNQLALDIEKIIQFLRSLFDWKAILLAHDRIRDAINASATIAANALKDEARIRRTVSYLTSAIGAPLPPALAGSSVTDAGGSPPAGSPVAGQMNSVQGKTMLQKSQDRPMTVTGSTGAGPAAAPSLGGSGVEGIIQQVLGLVESVLTSPPSDLLQSFHQALMTLESAVLTAIADAFALIGSAIADAIGALMTALNAEIDIPFVSEIYTWITGRKLTLLDVVALAAAVPAHIIYAILTEIVLGDSRTFADDAGPIVAQLQSAASGSVALGLGDSSGPGPAPKNNFAAEFMFAMLKTIGFAVTAVIDSMYVAAANARKAGGPGIDNTPAQGTLALLSGLSCANSMVCSSLTYFITGPHLRDRIKYETYGAAPGGSNCGDLFLNSFTASNEATFIVTMIGQGIGLLATCYNVCRGGGWDNESADGVFVFRVYASATGLMLGAIKLASYNRNQDVDSSSSAGQELELIRTRDVMWGIPPLFEWMFANNALNAIPLEAYPAIITTRAVAGGLGVIFNCVGVFATGDSFA